MTYGYPTNPPYAMGASLLTVVGLGSSLETVFGMGNPPTGFVNPSSLGGLVAWMDASQISGIVSGTSLSAWTDLSGLAHHASVGSAARQPVYVTNVKNSLPVVRFWSGATSSILSAPFALSQPATVIAAFSITTSAGAVQQRVLDGGTAANMIVLCNGALPVQLSMFAGAAFVGSGSIITAGNWYVGTGVFNGSSSTIRANGTGAAGSPGGGAPGGLSLGGSVDLSGPVKADIAEVAFYNRALTNTEYKQVESYLTTKWSIP